MLLDLDKSTRELYAKAGIVPMNNVDRSSLGMYLSDREKVLARLDMDKRILRAPDDLLDFTVATFDQGDFMLNWHIRVLCDLLMEFENPDSGLDRLIITMGPRSVKSELCSRRFPAWALGRQPMGRPIILGSYASDLAQKFSRVVQGVINSDTYGRIFPGVYLNPQHKGVKAWSLNNSSRDAFITTGRGGPITGMGGGIIILDDPIKNSLEAASETIGEVLWDWFMTTLRTRLEPRGKLLITMTRWFENDLVGRLKILQEMDPEADRYVIVNIPAIAEVDDEYRMKGEALHPERYSIKDLIRTRASMGTRDFNAMYQGNPVPPEGNRFKRAWFKHIVNPEDLPDARVKVRYWDWATTEDGGDWTVGMKVSMDITLQKYIEHGVRKQYEWNEAKKLILETAVEDGFDVVIGIEQIAKDATILKDLKAELRHLGYTVFTRNPGEKKHIEAKYFEELAAGDLVTIVRGGHWFVPWLNEICAFPLGEHDDQVDATSGAMKWLRSITADEIRKMVEERTVELPPWITRINMEDAHRVARAQNKPIVVTDSFDSDIAVRQMINQGRGVEEEIEFDIRSIV